MGRNLRDWTIVAAAIPAGLGLAWVITSLPFPIGVVFGAVVVTIATIFFWLMGGGAVVAVTVWLVPLLVLMLSLVIWPSRALALFVTGVILLPIAAWFIKPVEHALWRYLDRIGGWILAHSLSRTDRRTLIQLRLAKRGTPELRADSRQVDDLPRTLAAFRRHADNILAVEAPDIGWGRVIRDAAAPLLLYRGMLAGQRPLDFDEVKHDFTRTRRELREFLGSRSALYRLLSHRFVEVDSAPSGGEAAS